MVRLLIFTGTGGAGTTTITAATAVHAARCGVKTLLASADRAGSLSGAVGVRLAATPTEIQPGLFGLQIDARSSAAGADRPLRSALLALGLEPLPADDLLELPGAADVQTLLKLRDQVAAGSWDLVLLDAGPATTALRLLCLPDRLTRGLQRLLPIERRITRVLERGSRGATDDVVVAADRLAAELAGVGEVLRSADVSVRLVLTPRASALTQVRRTRTALAMQGFAVDGVIANQVRDTAGQPLILTEAADAFAGIRLQRCAEAEVEPLGPAALAEIGEALYGSPSAAGVRAILDRPVAIPPVVVEPAGTGFVLRLALPLAARDDLELVRVDDDLVLELAGGGRRIIPLTGALRRCQASRARLRDGVLQVRFEPDPDQWRPI